MIFKAEERVGKYRIISLLGQGGMGEVFLAEDTNLSREVALKVLQGGLSTDENFKEQFRREARSISRIVHPNIVQIYSMEEFNGRLFIDMEYVEGQSFSQIIKVGAIEPHLASSVALDVLNGLSVCHQAGVVHRDIKPSNILLTTTGHGKIADFGIAKALADSSSMALENTSSTTLYMGTPRYTPPEAWDGGTADARWDLYALGVMIYESLSGEPAFASTTMMSLMKEVTNDPLKPIETKVDGLSDEFASLINSLVEPEPAKRLQTAEAALEQLKGVDEVADHDRLDTPTITIQKPRPLSRPSAKTSSAKSRFVLIIAIVVIMISGLAYNWKQPYPQNDDSAIPNESSMPGLSIESAGSNTPVWWAEKLGSETNEGWTLLWEKGNALSPEHIIGFSDRGYMYLDLTKTDSQLSLSGEWAEYRTASGVGFQSGEVTGAAVSHDGQAGYTFTLSTVSNRDRTRRDDTYYIAEHPTLKSRTDFVRAVESDAWLPSLLVNEIQPRHISLGDHIDALLPASPDQRIEVPRVSSDLVPIYDGVLDESIWNKSFFGETGREGELAPLEAATLPPLLIRHDTETLFIGLTIPSDGAAEWGTEIAIRKSIWKPVSDSPRAVLKINDSGEQDLRCFERNREVPLPQQWSISSTTKNDVLYIEIGVPIEKGTDIDADARLRLVSMVWRSDGAGQRHTISGWGAESIDDIAHGALLCLLGNQEG